MDRDVSAHRVPRRGQLSSRGDLAGKTGKFVLACDQSGAGPCRRACDGAPLKAA